MSPPPVLDAGIGEFLIPIGKDNAKNLVDHVSLIGNLFSTTCIHEELIKKFLRWM